MSAKRKPSLFGSSTLVVGILVASGLLRLASNDFVAQAQTSDLEASSVPSKQRDEMDQSATLELFKKREERIAQKELLIVQKETALELAEERIAEQLEALRVAESQLRSTIALADSAAETDLQRLTEVYENMKPKIASSLFEQMDADFSAGFLSRMQPQIAASIIEGLSPTKAYAVSAILAGRNVGASRDREISKK